MNILFINSQSFWLNGWLNTPQHLGTAMDILSSMGISVSAEEVSHAKELETLLRTLPKTTLIWPNAYYTHDEAGEVVWLQTLIEKYQLPYVGTGVQGLKNMLDKVDTHQVLTEANVPIPQYLRISRENIGQLEPLFQTSGLAWPIVVKPTSESCSMGVIRADDLAQAKQHICQLFEDFPHSDALLESFLPNEDITCGYLELGNQIMLLPTYYKSREISGTTHIVERDLGVGPWGGDAIIMPPVEDESALTQLKGQMPALVQAMGISGITRADARMDAEGTLRFFDVNGMPALSFPKSVLVRQVRECFPHLAARTAYEYLLNTLVSMAAHRFNLTIPNRVQDQNLFSLEGGQVIRSVKQPAVTS